jgi:hypothetical protein
MTTPSLQTAGESLSRFWNNITGARPRRDQGAAPVEQRRDPAKIRREPSATPIDRAKRPRSGPAPRRGRLQAETLADSYIPSLRAGDYLFRTLKAEFDEFCEEAEIAPVSDKRFAAWLAAHGGRRYRDGNKKVTMYEIASRRRPAARSHQGRKAVAVSAGEAAAAA